MVLWLHFCIKLDIKKLNPKRGSRNTLPVVLSTDMVGQLDVFGHYGYTLSVYSAQVGVPGEASWIILSGLLQCLNHVYLKMQIILPTGLGNFVDQAHEGSPANEELSMFLVLADIMESHHL